MSYVNTFHPKTTRSIPLVERVGFLVYLSEGEGTLWGHLGIREGRCLERTYGIWVYSERFGLGSRSGALLWTGYCWEGGVNSMIRYLSKSYL